MSAVSREIGFVERDERHVLKIGKRSALVKYKTPETGTQRVKVAQIENISYTGAQVISRLPMEAAIGSFITLEFTLPGVQRRFFQKACIVRKIDTCSFAVCFVRGSSGDGSTLQKAIDEFSTQEEPSAVAENITQVAHWYHSNRQGLFIFAVTLAVAALVFSLVLKKQSDTPKVISLSVQGSFQGWEHVNSGHFAEYVNDESLEP